MELSTIYCDVNVLVIIKNRLHYLLPLNMAFSATDFEKFQQMMASNTDNHNGSLIDLESDESQPSQKQKTTTEKSGESQMLTQFIEMMKIVEENRKASEDRLLTLLSTQPQRNETLYRVMPDFSQTIENFDGEILGKKAMDWLASLESTAILHSWTQEIILETAKVHLVGTARKWYSEKSSEIRNFYDFKVAFTKTFYMKPNRDELWEKMRKRHQTKNESIFSYYHDKVTLCKALDYDFVETKEQVIIGLYNKQIIPGLVAARAENLDDLLHEIVEFDRITGKAHNNQQGYTQKFVKSNPASNVQTNLVKTTNVKEESTSDSTRLPARDENNRPLCFICKKYGHVSKYCRLKTKPKCSTCNNEGHLAKDCLAERRKEESSSVSSLSQLVVGKEDKSVDPADKYLRDIVINGKKVKALIDPGSAVCTIKEEIVREAKLMCEPTSEKLYGFGEGSTVCRWQTKLKVKIDNVEADVVALVVPDLVQPIDVLLGRSFTDIPTVAYVKIGNSLYFGQEDEPPFCNLEWRNVTNKKPITVENSITLLKNQINFIQVQDDNHERWLPVMNISKDDVNLEKGQKLGEFRGTKNEKEIGKSGEAIPIATDKVNIDKNLTSAERSELLQLLSNYRDVLATTIKEIGCTNLMEVDIKDSGIPVRAKPYRTTQKDRETIRNIVREWRECGIVRDTKSPYASPVLLVPKSSGEKRLVVDFRRLNNQTVRNNFPIPNIDDCFETLSGCRLFCTLDLMSGYLQVPLSEESKGKTAFITPDETAEFERLSFGLVNAPYEFSKLMSLVFGHLRDKTIIWYLDDILVPAKDFRDMLNRLILVFEALREAHLTLNLSKCIFGQSCVNYLGFRLSGEGLQPSIHKLRAIEEFATPKNKHELKRFLGLTGFFRRFVEKYSLTARPLTDLTKAGRDYRWTKDQECAFQKLKLMLQESPTLQLYNPKARTELHCDASIHGIAGMLLQEGVDQKLHLVYCVSKKTNDAEQKYHSSKLELLAILWSVERLRHLLLGIKFTVVSDCQALVYLNAKKTIQPQIARWYSILAEYDMEIRYRPGDKMSHVDCLSRAATEEPSSSEIIDEIYEKRLNIFLIISEEERIMMIQRSDKKLSNLIDILKKDEYERDKEEKSLVHHYEIDRGRLYKQVKVNGQVRWLYVIPDSMRKATVIKYHDQMGHWSLDRTVTHILRKFWFRGLRRYIRQHIRGCFECLLVKVPGGRKSGKLHSPRLPERPMIKLHVDHLGPFQKSVKGNQHILVIVDAYSRFVRLYPVKSTKSTETALKMEEFVCQYGAPRIIVSDQGTAFTGHSFTEFCEKYDIEHKTIASHYPQANGMAENRMKSIIPVIITSFDFDDERWDKAIFRVERKMNTAINKTMGCSPFECLYGYIPTYEDACMVNHANRDTDIQSVDEIRKKVRENVAKSLEKSTAYYDKTHCEGVKYEIGDIVAIKRKPTYTGEPTKTQLKYRGPLVVIEILPSDCYRLEQLNNEDGGKIFTTTSHVSQMKIYRH